MSEKLKTVTNNILLLTKCKNMVYISNTEDFLFCLTNTFLMKVRMGQIKR